MRVVVKFIETWLSWTTFNCAVLAGTFLLITYPIVPSEILNQKHYWLIFETILVASAITGFMTAFFDRLSDKVHKNKNNKSTS
jgi:hypothetical protein